MNKDRTMPNVFLTMLAVLMSLSMMTSMANASSSVSLDCETANGLKQFSISNQNVTFKSNISARAISSVKSVRTIEKSTGFTKTMYLNGDKVKIHIRNLKEMNQIDDYICFQGKNGHKMTYPISCSAKI
jgi:hypothetical protein